MDGDFRSCASVWNGGNIGSASAPILEGRFLATEKVESSSLTMPEHGEKLETYAKSFNGLSQIFSQMENFKNNFEPEEMGKMQQEIAGKVCMSCDQCAICWQEEASPMYELFTVCFIPLKRGDRQKKRYISSFLAIALILTV